MDMADTPGLELIYISYIYTGYKLNSPLQIG